MSYILNNGILLPKEEPKPPEHIRRWDCPHCGRYYDMDLEPREEATLGIPYGAIRHINCPECEKCMGCSEKRA
jgi:hypothetical protein